MGTIIFFLFVGTVIVCATVGANVIAEMFIDKLEEKRDRERKQNIEELKLLAEYIAQKIRLGKK